MFWTIPQLWPDSTVFIIGGGPSVLQHDLSLIHDQRVIGVNHSFSLGPWVDVCWFGDKQWFETNIAKLRQYGGLIATCCTEPPRSRRMRVKYVGRSKQTGIEYQRRTHVAWNSNSGASAISLAYWLGARRVVLLGFDMHIPDDPAGRTHWHDEYPRKLNRNKTLVNPYPRFLRGWPQIAKDAEKIGLEIITCCADSPLMMIPFKPYEEVCQDL